MRCWLLIGLLSSVASCAQAPPLMLVRTDTAALTAALKPMANEARLAEFYGDRVFLVSATSIDSTARAYGAHHPATWLRSAQQHFGLAGICGSPNWHCSSNLNGHYLALGVVAPYHADTVVVVVGTRFVATPMPERIGERVQREWQIGLFRTDTLTEPRGFASGRRYRIYLVRDTIGWRALRWSDRLPESNPIGLQP